MTPVPERSRPLTVGVVRETAPRERRVALDPEGCARLVSAGRIVVVETGAGGAANFSDDAYRTAGASLASRTGVVTASDVLVVVRPPDVETTALLRPGQLVIGMLGPRGRSMPAEALAARGVTAASFDLLPRTLSRAQSMDATSSQASAAGYRAGVVAAAAFDRYLPMMITASGTAPPASALVIGAGVAGLQAIATLRRLGAVVSGYDVRPASRGEVESLGAAFVTSSVAEGAGAGGYARPLTADESVAQQDELAHHVVAADIVVTTAKVPGRTPPLLVTAATLALMRPGSVVLDLAAGDARGNVAGSVDGRHRVTDRGVVVIGAGEMAADLPTSASHMYARNVQALLASLAPREVVSVDPTDEVHAAVVVCQDGHVTPAAVPVHSEKAPR